MTREEAIANLNMISVAFVDPVTKEQRKLINDTFDMAIQALSQEPTECDDAISRKLAIRAIKNLYPDIPRVDFNGAKRKWADKYAQYIECERLIEQLPPVTQKLGHWTYIGNSEVNGLKIVKCSECNKRTYGSSNYCPNCGCRMVEPQESEKINCKSTKCENCINHNYCDYEPQESEVRNDRKEDYMR